MLNILLVEDNEDICNTVSKYLIACDFDVSWSQSVADTKWLLSNKYFDVIVMDWMLPDGDGAMFCKEIKQQQEIPIIMMTAKHQIEDKTIWFEYWADDYIVKPFDLKELELRINAIKKRYDIEDVMIIWDVNVDIDRQEIYKSNQKIEFTHLEFLIIKILITWFWLPISRTQLLEDVWWEDSIYDNSNKLDVYISNIRKKLWKEFIQTIKWFWYKIWK